MHWRFQVAADAEVSIELDPETADRKTLKGYVAAGVNRLSVGGQSLNDKVLQAIGRQHGAEGDPRDVPRRPQRRPHQP